MNAEVQGRPGPRPWEHRGGRRLPGRHGPPRDAEAQVRQAAGPRQPGVPGGEPHEVRALPGDIPPRGQDGRRHRSRPRGLGRRPHGGHAARHLPSAVLPRSRAHNGGGHGSGPHGARQGFDNGRHPQPSPRVRRHPWGTSDHRRDDRGRGDIRRGRLRHHRVPGVHRRGGPGPLLEQA